MKSQQYLINKHLCAGMQLLFCVSMLMGTAEVSSAASRASISHDRLEPGLQGESSAQDSPGTVLTTPYSKGVRVVGHSAVWNRDSNVQLSWVDHCAYIASSRPNFLGWGVTAEPATYGVAVIDVSDPSAPKAVKVLRDRGALYSAEAMDAVAAPDRDVLVAATYEDGLNAEDARWVSIYDVSDCANPKLMAELQWPEKIHTLAVAPNGKRVYATHLDPFTGNGGLHALDITDLSHPRYLGKFGVTRADGTAYEFAPHEVSISADEKRIYAGVIASKGEDLNEGIKIFPPNAEGLGPNAGGIYVLDNSDIAEGRADPKLRLIGTSQHGGWHSVMIATINGVPSLVGAGELEACPGAWPKFTDVSDEMQPHVVAEFKLQMNQQTNCPPRSATEKATGGIVPDAGTATLHYNDVDSETDTRLGLFNFMWAGMRIVDLRKLETMHEVAYFKPGDACTGHARYEQNTGHIWFTCAKSGFYVIELTTQIRKSLGLPQLSSRKR